MLTSHLVCFTVFELMRKKYKGVDIFTLLRTPVEEVSIPYAEVVDGVNRLKEKLKEMQEAGEVQLSPELRWNADKIIEHGMKNINLYHTASPLVKEGDKMGSEDLKLLYYYRNRLDGYGLEKFV